MNKTEVPADQKISNEILERNLLAAIIDTIGALLIVTDYEGRIVRFNRACEELTGYSFAEVKGKMFWEVVLPKEEIAGVRKIFKELLAGHFPNKYENHWLTKSGEIRLISWSNTAITNAQNEVEYIVGTGIEITNQRLAEKALRESEGRYRTVISAMSEGVVLQDSKGELMAINASAERILGLSKEQLKGVSSISSILKVVQEDGTPFPLEEHPAFVTFQTGQPCKNIVMGLNRLDGSFVWIRVNTMPVFENGEAKPHSIVISFSDITERKRAEQEMWYIKRAIEWTSDAIKMTDINRQSIYHNRAFIKLLGYTPKELNDLGGATAIYVDSKVEKGINFLLESGKTFQGEVELRTKEGEVILVEMTADVVQDETGRIIGRIAIYVDVRERRRIEQQIRQTLKMEAIGRLAGGVAHDFNNMLTAISGYSELSLRQLDKSNPLVRNLTEIKKAAERSADLTGKLLAFSRRQAQKLEILNINAVIEEMKGMLERLLGEDLEFITTLDPDIGKIKADAGQIEQVLMNLVVNARDAMPEGGKIVIETKNVFLDENFVRSNLGANAGSYVLLSVTDSGTGMDSETKARIFEPFFTTKEPGKGTGLGLATVYGIIKQSAGYITVQTEVGRGTNFKIYFPQVKKPVKSTAQLAETKKDSRGSETILLTEDEELVRNLGAEVLRLSGYKVLTAASGEEALEICRNFKEKIHLLITDIVMPGISGHKLAEVTKQLHPEMKILFISGYSNEVVLNKNNSAEKIPFLEKPFMPENLTAKVYEILNQS